jgi:hypothetical protein
LVLNSAATVAKLQKKKKMKNEAKKTGQEQQRDSSWVVSLTSLHPFLMRGTNVSFRSNNKYMKNLETHGN